MTEAKSEIFGIPISRNRSVSIITYTDNTAYMAIRGNGLSVDIHLSPEDVDLFIDALHGGSHA